MGRNRRWRRAARARTLLPLHTGRLFNTISCWYCDLKISAFNNFLFSFGQKKSRFLHTWFSVGVGFSITALVGVTTILLWELVKILQQDNRDTTIRTFSTDLLFGLNPLVPIWHISLLDAGYLIFSTILSVSIHEFGHAIAAASEGVQIEYIAIFLAILFPGALVAFSNDVLECLPRLNVLRIYCAGIWHNAVDHTCLAPVLAPVFSWVEIVYATSSSSQCLQSISNIIPSFDKSIFESTQCGGSFVFIGDVFSIVSTIKLTMYYPRWVFKIGANVPNILEKMVLYTFYVSATLALLNSLPVFFLDGEFILEAFLTNINWLNRRRKRQLLQLCLLSGSSLTIFLFSKAVIHIFLAHR